MPASGPSRFERAASANASSARSATTLRIGPSSASTRRSASVTNSVGCTRPSRTAALSSTSIGRPFAPGPRHIAARAGRAATPPGSFDTDHDALVNVRVMADRDKIAQLRGIEMFADLPDDALEQLAADANDFDAPAGHVLVQAHQPGSGLLILTSGRATVELGAQTLECGEGECIGELS